MIKEVDAKKYIGNPYGYILPLSVSGVCSGDFDYEVYDSAREYVRDILEGDNSDYLTESFYKRVDAALREYAKSLGYEPDGYLTHTFILNYRFDSELNSSLILPDTLRLDDLSAYTDLTDTEFDTEEFPVFASLVGGRLVSVCGANGFIEENTVEIAVATAAPFGGRGYALSNVTAMTNFLKKSGFDVAYQCYPDNEASISLARSAGFYLHSRDYNYVCYERED